MRILITCGDPNGVGMELLFRALSDGALDAETCARLTLCAPGAVAAAYARRLVRSGLIGSFEMHESALVLGSRSIGLLSCSALEYEPEFGTPTVQSGAVARAALEYAAQAILRRQYDALVTLPVSKEALAMAGFTYPGHTEFFGSIAGCTPLMVLACTELRVALVTVHIPIAQVAQAVTFARQVEVIEQFHRTLVEDFALERPRLAVLGLNPHAGEHGLIGEQEERIIKPAIAHVQAKGIAASGPFAADGFFAHRAWQSFDGVIAQYHDQGLIPLKMIAGGSGVNITAGLPFVRTSPDHGTAYDRVGTGSASYRSLIAAIGMAQYLAANRHRRFEHVSPT